MLCTRERVVVHLFTILSVPVVRGDNFTIMYTRRFDVIKVSFVTVSRDDITRLCTLKIIQVGNLIQEYL